MAEIQPAEKKKFYKTWWFWAIVLVILYAIGSSSLDDARKKAAERKEINRDAATSTEQTTAQPTESTLKITAEKLSKDYDDNGVLADENYKDKILAVTGIVKNIDKDITGKPYVVLKGYGEYGIIDIQCSFSGGDQSKLLSLKNETETTLIGKVSGHLLNVMMSDCKIE